MDEPIELAFKTSPNKDFLRRAYDKPIIRAWFSAAGRQLDYLGLPGPDMLDIVEWQEFLRRFTAIERRENEQHLMFLRANVKDLEHRLHSLYGEFDKILLAGRDRYDHAPRWPYDLVNLDYFGGLIYQDLSRPKALNKLIQNQDEYQRSFLLIITNDLRDGDFVGEKHSFFEELGRRLIQDSGREEVIIKAIDRFKASSTPDAARQTAYTNVLLRDCGESAHFRVKCRPAIVYAGTGGTKMVHYVTEFHHSPRGYRAVSEQSLVQIVNLGYRELRDGRFIEQSGTPRID